MTEPVRPGGDEPLPDPARQETREFAAAAEPAGACRRPTPPPDRRPRMSGGPG
ncbi:hypothetical protein [Modestobacter sp. SYSU DS0657]